MLLDRLPVRFECCSPRSITLCRHRTLVIDQRHFTVDHQILAFREPNHEVRQMAVPAFILDRHLGVVMLTSPKASQFQRLLKLGLAPIPDKLFVSFQSAGEILCFA